MNLEIIPFPVLAPHGTIPLFLPPGSTIIAGMHEKITVKSLTDNRVQLKDRPDQKGEVITLGKDYAVVMFDKGKGASCGYTFDSLEPEKK